MITSERRELAIRESPNRFLDSSVGISSSFKRDLAAIYSPNANYTFLRTSANPEAVEILSNYFGERKSQSEPWQTSIRNPCQDSEPIGGDHRKLSFSPSLMDTYRKALEELAKAHLGPKSYASFPLIATERVHSLDRTPESVFWPVIHVIKGNQRAEEFKALVSTLNGVEAHNIVKAIEGPTAYRIAEVDVLRNLKISPLLFEERSWEVDAGTLRNAADFLIPFVVYGPEYHDGPSDD